MFFQQAYNLVDSWIAGNYLGDVALGAIGTCYPITLFLIAISSGLSLGTSIFCSQAFGAKNYKQVKTAINSSLFSYLPLSVIVSTMGLILSPTIVTLLSVPDDAFTATVVYMRIYIIGFPFQFLYNISNSVLTGLGNSRSPLIFLIISSICNIALDWIFVTVLNTGVAGLALATILSQLLSAMLSLWTVFGINKKMPSTGQHFSSAIMKDVVKLGIPSMMQHILVTLGQFFLQNIINSYGLIVMAGFSIAFRINGLVMNTIIALSNALSGYIAQNKGANQYGRIRVGIRVSIIISTAFSVFMFLALRFFGEEILGLFMQDSANSAEIIAVGMNFCRITAPFYFVVGVKIVFDGVMRGMGAMTIFMIATISDLVVRLLCAYPFSHYWGLNGVWAIWPSAWFVGAALSITFYLLLIHKNRALFLDALD